jgi:hypothetical protein
MTDPTEAASTPPSPDSLLAMMREAIVEDPEQNALIIVGTEGKSTLIPCIAVTPAEALSLLPGMFDSIDWVAIVSDTYRLVTHSDERPVLAPGQLGEMFAAGDPRVKEAIMVFCLAPDGPSYSKQQTYTRTDGEIVWEEPVDYPLEETSGALANGIRRALGMEMIS